jgi:maltooligosyltrehalose trehalohydrolase
VKSLGARPGEDGTTCFRVWAPAADHVAVRVGGEDVAMASEGSGLYAVTAQARPGDDYWFVLDGQPFPDPCSRSQPDGLRGPSRVVAPVAPVAPPALAARRSSAEAPSLPDTVIYELHVGTFSDEGTFVGAIARLGALARLGVGAIELMPVAEFPGSRGWGYDGVYLSAAQSSYGGPDGLLQLVAAAHEAGLAVILDVVYNHVGTSGVQALEAFGPYFTDRYETPWGRAIDYECPAVREWVCQSAEQWVGEFGIDGLRLDAIHAIEDPSPEPIVAEIARRVHALAPGAFVIGEVGLADPEGHGGDACDAVWDDHFHHSLHVLLTGERDGYYEPFGRVGQLADAFAQAPPSRYVVYGQNHDQVGNRAFGDRLAPELRPLAAFCTLLSPFVALLFMGEEYGEDAPFQFFSDHIDPEIAHATREGRREEFASFASFSSEEIPDPQDVATFERSKLTRREDPRLAELYRELIALRRELGAGAAVDGVEFDEDQRWLRVRRGRFELVCNFAREPRELLREGERVVLSAGSLTGPGLPGRAELPKLPGRAKLPRGAELPRHHESPTDPESPGRAELPRGAELPADPELRRQIAPLSGVLVERQR